MRTTQRRTHCVVKCLVINFRFFLLQVIHPIWHRVTFTRCKAYISLGCVWLIGPLFNAPLIATSKTRSDGLCYIYSEWPSPVIQRIFGLCSLCITFFIPLIILIYTYGRIAHRLTKAVMQVSDNREVGNATTGSNQHKDDRYQRARRNTFKTLAIVAASFVLCLSWNQIYFLMMNLGFPYDYDSPFYHFTVVAMFLNCCINPLIYALKYEQFQAAAKMLFCNCSKESSSNNDIMCQTH